MKPEENEQCGNAAAFSMFFAVLTETLAPQFLLPQTIIDLGAWILTPEHALRYVMLCFSVAKCYAAVYEFMLEYYEEKKIETSFSLLLQSFESLKLKKIIFIFLAFKSLQRKNNFQPPTKAIH